LLDPDSTASIIVFVVLLALHAFFAASREAIASVRKSRRLQFIEEGKPAAQIVDDLAENTSLLLTAEQIALKFLSFSIVAFATLIYTVPLAQAFFIGNFAAAIIIIVVAVVLILFFGELIPKELARNYAEPIAFWTVYPFHWISYLAVPFLRLAMLIGRILTGRWNDVEEYQSTTFTEEDLRSYLDVGEEEGVLREEEREMIHSIFELDDTLAREVMVPRIDMVAIGANASLEEAIHVAMNAGHSRLPVYTETIDNVVGILYVKDLLVYWNEKDAPKSIKGLEREVYFVPETKPASELLRELQAKKVHIAIVVDEYGGTAGLVTIEDVLEEIVGEIQDEHDADEFYMQYVSDDEYIFSARMDLDDINNTMSIELPTDESDTLGGLIYDVLGRIPKAGDSLSGESFGVPNLFITVLDVEGRRIKSVRINRINKDSSGNTTGRKATPDPNSSTLINNTQKPLSESS